MSSEEKKAEDRAPETKKAGSDNIGEQKSREPTDHDVMLLHSPTEDGEVVRALRFRPGRLDMTELHPVRDGQAVGDGELLKLTPKEKAPFFCDVDVLYSPEDQSQTSLSSHAGPARVTSHAYRQNWDRVFGSGEPGPGKKHLLH